MPRYALWVNDRPYPHGDGRPVLLERTDPTDLDAVREVGWFWLETGDPRYYRFMQIHDADTGALVEEHARKPLRVVVRPSSHVPGMLAIWEVRPFRKTIFGGTLPDTIDPNHLSTWLATRYHDATIYVRYT